jgi:GT2 family glycosyltransferase
MIEIVSATRLPESEFWDRAALGLSLRRLAQDERLVPRIAYANRRGLPEVYNARIDAAGGPELLVFMHDDVWIDDDAFAQRVFEGLRAFDVVGVAGNRRRVPRQPSWVFVENAGDKFRVDDRANLSGAVAHGKEPRGEIVHYGPAPAACELLDGVFLAANKPALTASGVRFDPRFEFHFYDLDLCRRARECGLRLGTWPIGLTHQSDGAFASAAWRDSYRAYLEKWKD